jgi:hypothetical protein
MAPAVPGLELVTRYLPAATGHHGDDRDIADFRGSALGE